MEMSLVLLLFLLWPLFVADRDESRAGWSILLPGNLEGSILIRNDLTSIGELMSLPANLLELMGEESVTTYGAVVRCSRKGANDTVK